MELVIDGLSKTYPNGVRALKNITLQIQPGMFGLLGPNGAGKSTLMRTIATLQQPDDGTVHFGEIDVLHDQHSVRKILGYLPQEFGVYPKVSAERLLTHFATLKGIHNARERRQTVADLLHLTNLYQHRKKSISGFSGGMKQRFGIAQALLGNPKLIIVDEPTAGLDPEERVRFHNLLSDIGRHIVVILSTHIVSDVADLFGHMAIINSGEVLLQGKPQEHIHRLVGKIWQKVIDKSELAEVSQQVSVIASRLVLGQTQVRAFSETSLAPDFEQVTPDLEDVYFAAIHGCLREREPVTA